MKKENNNKENNQFGHSFAWDENFKGRIIVALNDKVYNKPKSE